MFDGFQTGTLPPVRASGPHDRSIVPLAWPTSVGTGWQSSQAIPGRRFPPARCAWWAPTARVAGSLSPRRPSGGAAFTAEPWQEEQVSGRTSSFPSMWSARFTVPAPYPSWQLPHDGFCECGGGGGAPWHVPQAAWLPSTLVQVGAVIVPPAASVAPWQ